MATVRESVVVNMPLSQTYNQWTQFEEFPRFMTGVESVRQVDETTVHFQTRIAGLRRGFDARILAQIPDELISWESVEGPHHSGTVTFHAVSTVETRVTVEVDWDPRTVLERAGATAHLEDRQIKKNLERFKEFIEGREVETGAWRGSIAGGKVEGRS